MNINEIVDKYLPDAIERLYPEFTPFFKVYMEWMQENGVYDVLNRFDIDQAPSKFLDNFVNVYLNNVPTANPLRVMSEEEIRRFVKEITDVNKSKGLDSAIKYFFSRIFGADIGIEHGLLGVLLKYKPTEVVIEAIDVNGAPVQNPNWHVYSFKEFVVKDNQTLNGFSQTYFNDGENKLWVDSLNGTLKDGDVLYFPDGGYYARVLNVAPLDLDGWLGQKERWTDADGMYITGRYNNRLYNTFPVEINGFSEFTVFPYTASNATYSSEFTSTGNLTFTVNDSTYTGIITETYQIQDDSGVVYTATTEFNVVSGLIDSIKVNGVVETITTPASNITRQYNATEFYDANGKQAMTSDELSLVMDRVAIHTIYLKTDVPRDVYFQLIRDIVFPAGFSIFTLFTFFSGFLDTSGEYTNSRLYNLFYKQYIKDFIDINNVIEYVKTKIQLGERFVSMSMLDWDAHYKYDLWTDRFIGNIDSIDEFLVGIIDTPDYTDVPFFTLFYPKKTEVSIKYDRSVVWQAYSFIKLNKTSYIQYKTPSLYSMCYWMNNEMDSPFSQSYFKTDVLDSFVVGFFETDACNTTDILYDTNYAPPTGYVIKNDPVYIQTSYTNTDLVINIA